MAGGGSPEKTGEEVPPDEDEELPDEPDELDEELDDEPEDELLELLDEELLEEAEAEPLDEPEAPWFPEPPQAVSSNADAAAAAAKSAFNRIACSPRDDSCRSLCRNCTGFVDPAVRRWWQIV